MTDERPEDTGRDVQVGQLAAVLVLGIALGAFILQNTQDTTIEWLAWDGTQPLWLVLLITSAISLVLARVGGAVVRRMRR